MQLRERTHGQGSPGFCKLCASENADAINKMIAAGKNEGQVRRALYEIDPSFTWSKPTFYGHKDHITHPLVTAVQNAKNHPVIVPKTNRGALEAIRDIAMQRAIAQPDTVTVDHGLKALSILESGKKPVENIFVLMAKVMTGQPVETIIGEYTDMTEEATVG